MDTPTLNILYTQFHILFYLLIFALCYGEGLAFVGIFVPGSISLILSGYLAAQGAFDLGDLFVFSVLGGIAGDVTSYYIGRSDMISIKTGRAIFNEKRLLQGENFFLAHGPKSVFWGRFIGFIRPIIPFVAGVLKMPERKFWFWVILSVLTWSATHLVVGYYFYHSYRSVLNFFGSFF